jgi:hypothetical protein
MYGNGSSQDWIIPLVSQLVADGKQVIVFRETKGETRGCARYLANALGLPSAEAALAGLPAGDPSQASQDLRQAVAQAASDQDNGHVLGGQATGDGPADPGSCAGDDCAFQGALAGRFV